MLDCGYKSEAYKNIGLTIIDLMRWRTEKEEKGNKTAARAIQRIIDAYQPNAPNDEKLRALAYQRDTGVKIIGW